MKRYKLINKVYKLIVYFKQLKGMGNILDTLSSHKTQVFTGLSTLAVINFIIRDALQKRSLRNKQLQAILNENKSKAENSNELYLKTHTPQYWLRGSPKHPVYKIVITGGPCGGKTSSFNRIRQVFSEKGFRVFCVPEVNTMVVLGGATALIPKLTAPQFLQYQALLIRFQMFAEDYFMKLAQMCNQPAIILCDRGTVDPYAYMSDQSFQAVLDQEGWTWVTLRDKRYDLVCFLSSAANGAQKFYTVENNAARSQGIQLARKLDKRTLQAWIGHPHIVVAPNLPNQTFEDKINRIIQAVRNMVGQELHTLINHKFLIKQPVFPEGLKYQTSQIQEIFLINNDPDCKQNKLKKRGVNFSYTYYQKYIFKTSHPDYTQQLRKQLVPKQYMALRETMMDKNFNPVQRKRIDFICDNFSYCIDVYDNIAGEKKVYLLRFFARKGEAAEFVPPFIEVIRDVRHQKQFKLREIARKNKEQCPTPIRK